MLRLAKAFLDIALWKRTPAHLPASSFLLCLVAVIAALVEVMGALLPPTSLDGIFMRVALTVGLPLAFAWAVLALTSQRHRFLQTGIALLGVAVLAQLAFYPLSLLLTLVGASDPAAAPIWFLVLCGLVWYLLACANIWRAALDSSLLLGGAISVGYLLLSMLIEDRLLPIVPTA